MKSIKNLLIYGAGESLGKGLNILLMVILPFLLPVNEYGKLAVVVITEQILMFLLLRGQNNSILRFWNKGNKQREYLYSTISNALIKRNSYIYSVVFIFIFIYAIIDVDGYSYLIILMSIPFLVLTELKLAVFRVEGKSKQYVVYRITFQTLKFILVITFINFYFNSVLGYCIGVLGAVLIVNYCFKMELYKSSFYTKKSAITDVVLNYGTPLGLQVAINLFYSAADRYMLLYLTDTATVSIYSFSYTLATTLLFFVNIAIVGLIPIFYKIEPANSAFKYLIKIFLSIGVFITLLGILINLYIYPVMISLYDMQYMKGQQTFWIILISNLFHVFYLFSFYKLAYMKKVKNIPVYTVIALLLNVCLNFYLIPKYGMEGAAIATVISELFLACMLFIYSKNKAIKFHG